jgi:NADH:ubiquinone oxidoreductase subunit F (NADH-binding)
MTGPGVVAVSSAADPDAQMLDLALNATRFFRNESCGKCVLCGVGSEKLVKIGERLAASPQPREDEHGLLAQLVLELQNVMEQTSICGLGTSASKPMAPLFQHVWPRVNQSS